MDRTALLAAIKNSGGAEQPDGEVDGLLGKLTYLKETGRYGRLIASIASANDKSNFLASVLEATFAFQFESAGFPLDYEVRQDEDHSTSIDFLRKSDSGTSIYFEARLLQQDNATTESIKDQLEKSSFYEIAMDGQDEHDAIIRLQNVILSKVQKRDGTPVKFLRVAPDTANLVVVDVSDLILGTVDVDDCLLATHGDPAVREEHRRGIFGLFQEPLAEYPERIQTIAKTFEHIRSTLSGVLFLFRPRGSGVLDYRLEQHLMYNARLIDENGAKSLHAEITAAVPVRSATT